MSKKSRRIVFNIVLFSFFILSIAGSTYLSKRSQDLRSKASQDPITAQTEALLNTFDLYKNEKSKDKRRQYLNDLVYQASFRKGLIMQKIESDPGLILQNAISRETRDTMPIQVSHFIEKKVDLTGKLNAVHADFEDFKGGKLYFLLKTPENIYKLYFTKSLPESLIGAQVQIPGILINNNLVTEEARLVAGQIIENLGQSNLSTLSQPQSATPKTEKIAIILVNFAANRIETTTHQKIREIMFDNTDSVAAYYRENSYGRVNLGSGDVFGWYTLTDYDGTNCMENYYHWADSADQKARIAGVNLDEYSRYLYIFGRDSTCGNWAGAAHLGDNKIYISGNPNWPFLLAHEFGHSLGVHHANVIDCREKSIDKYSECTSFAVDSFDVMGSGLYHFNSPHKAALSWISPLIVTESNIFTLTPLEFGPTGTKALKIRKPDTNDYYYVSFRGNTGSPFSKSFELVPQMTAGVSIHVWDDKPFTETKFIDTIPSNDKNWADAALSDGRSFYDEINKIRVSQISHDANSVTVRVDLNSVSTLIAPTAAPTNTPTRAPTPTSRPTVTPTRIPTSTPRPITPTSVPTNTPTRAPTPTSRPTVTPTRIPTSTPRPIPTESGPTILNFKIDNFSNFKNDIPVTIFGKDDLGRAVFNFERQTITDSSGYGSINLSGLKVNNTYTFYIKGDRHLVKLYPSLVSLRVGVNPRVGVIDFGTITAGDVNGDNQINQTDRDLVSAKYGQNVNSTLYKEDLNQDGIVNLYDLSTINTNFGKIGD